MLEVFPLTLPGAQALSEPGGAAMFPPEGRTVWELLVQVLSLTEQGDDGLAPTCASTLLRMPAAIPGLALARLEALVQRFVNSL